MAVYILKRVGLMFVTLFFVVTITFFLMRSIPGDPVTSPSRILPPNVQQAFLVRLGIVNPDTGERYPLYMQYFKYLQNILKLDLGLSSKYQNVDVSKKIVETFPISVRVGGTALCIGTIIGTALGVVAALFKNKWPDYIVMVLAILGITVPVFVMAPLLQYFLSLRLKLLPTFGWGQLIHYVMPVTLLCFGPIATFARYMKSGMLDTLNQDYILTAQSKGVSGFNVIWKHALRNSFLPSLAMLAAMVANVFMGAFIIERTFGIPGIGKYFIASINEKDYSMTLGLTVFSCVIFIVVQLVVDIVYCFVDPRIKLAPDKN